MNVKSMDKFKNILVSKAKIVDYEIETKRRSNPYIVYIICTYSKYDKESHKKGYYWTTFK